VKTPWYRMKQYQGALVSWNALIPDGVRRQGILLRATRVRSGDPRSIRTVLEVLPFGSSAPERIETWQAQPHDPLEE